MANKYYKVVGYNGFMVANNWPQVKRAEKYISGIRYKRYNCREEAIIETLAEFNMSHPNLQYNDEVVLNHIYFTKNLVKVRYVEQTTEENKSESSSKPKVLFRYIEETEE